MSLNQAQPVAAQPAKEKKECDIVMKGGITSGIIYPPLVIKLHKDGRAFRSVGGTSAGAIAAAVTAAAEYGKVDHEPGINEPPECSFHKLDQIRKWLGRDEHLKNLFRPSRATAPLMNTIFGYPKLKFLRWPPLKLTVALLFNNTLAFICGALLGLAFSFLLSFLIAGNLNGVMRGWGLIVPVFFALTGGLLAGLWRLYHILKNVLPAHGFGLCTGRGKNPNQLDKTVLTDWLFVNINKLAGKGTQVNDAPLTFGELWEKNRTKPGERGIDLRMMTSDLSQNQPYVLPFEKDLFVFKEDELLQLFPPGVVQHMVRHARPYRGVILPKGYYFLPDAKHLPVIFATRLSLSFPVLISMVPLYTISRKAFKNRVRCEIEEVPAEIESATKTTKEQIVFIQETDEGELFTALGADRPALEVKDLQVNWFSDGGICSNFPIHFFDSWLPTRPTFGVNLTSQLAKGTPQTGQVADIVKERSSIPPVLNDTEMMADARSPAADEEDVYLPRPNDVLPPEWMPIEGIGKFFETIFRTAQNYRDNMQSMLPSYRERIVQVRLTDDEGGLNLNMSSSIIKKVADKGEDAGDALVKEFRMDAHQWVRFRVLMKQIEASLNKLNKVIAECPFYMEALNPPLPQDFPYRRDDTWLLDAKGQLEALSELIRNLTPHELFQPEPPLPEPVLRVTPQI